MAHVGKVAAVGTQVVFHRLFIAYIDEKTIENGGLTSILGRRLQAKLHHILHEPDGLESYGFAASIGP